MITPAIGIHVRPEKPTFSARQTKAKRWYFTLGDWFIRRKKRSPITLFPEHTIKQQTTKETHRNPMSSNATLFRD